MANEPKVPNLISNSSFLRMPTPAMRSAPEILTLELQRKIFYEIDRKSKASKKDRLLQPFDEDNPNWTKEERFTIEAFRGRRKLAGDRKPYYAPAFPALARNSWLRAKDPVTVDGFLFEGPICHYLKSINADQIKIGLFSSLVVKSLIDDSKDRDIFVHSLKDETPNTMLSISDAEDKLSDYLQKKINTTQTLSDHTTDVFSETATKDFVNLLCLQDKIPRMLWISMLQGFLRLTMSISLIGKMKSTEILWSWILDAVEKNIIPHQTDIDKALRERHEDIFQPSEVEFDGLASTISSYSKTRVKLSCFLEDCLSLKLISEAEYEGKFSVASSPAKDELHIKEFLETISRNSQAIASNAKRELSTEEDNSFEIYMNRKCSNFNLYTKGNVGQSKNISEFLKIIEKSEGFDDNASHVFEKVIRRRSKHKFRTSPGQLLIEMIALFADLNKFKDSNLRKRNLSLIELEAHFRKYGINYTLAADGRRTLMKRLTSAGILSGSPDAGDSISVINPYKSLMKQLNAESEKMI